MNLPTLHELRRKLLPMTQSQVFRLSEKAGVPYSTLDKIRRGVTRSPEYLTVAALWRVL